MFTRRIAIGLVCASALVLLTPPTPSWAKEPASVLVFGDSLSAGYGIRIEDAWPALLQKRLGNDWKVINASRSGETTAGGLTRLPAALAAHRPQLVVLELGANDGLRGTSLEVASANLSRMITLARDAGAQVVLISIRLPANFGKRRNAELDAMYAGLASKHGLAPPAFLFEGFAERPELFLEDGIHPSKEAQPRLLDNVWAAIAAGVGRR